VKTNVSKPQANCLAKTFETLIKTICMLLCAAEYPNKSLQEATELSSQVYQA